MTDTVIFLVKTGKPLELVREHIQGVIRVQKEVTALADDLGCERVTTDRCTGVLAGVVFPGAKHADFSAPDRKRRVSRPKNGTEWAKRFAEQKGYADPAKTIATAFDVPTSISYTCDDGSYGSSMLGSMMQSCGFAYLSADGPYAIWIPDVAAAISDYESKGYKVNAETKAFKMEIPGCQRIESEEWGILVAQHSLAKKKARKVPEDLVAA